jgi:hypothetical protein
MTEAETSKQRSAVRSAVFDVLAGAPPEGLAVAAIMELANVVSRDAVDHLLHRMVEAGEVQRRGRGRYVRAGTLQRQTAPAAPTPPQRQIGPPATGAAPTQRTSEPPAIRPEPAHQARGEAPMVEKLGDAATICRALGKAWDDARFGPEGRLTMIATLRQWCGRPAAFPTTVVTRNDRQPPLSLMHFAARSGVFAPSMRCRRRLGFAPSQGHGRPREFPCPNAWAQLRTISLPTPRNAEADPPIVYFNGLTISFAVVTRHRRRRCGRHRNRRRPSASPSFPPR